MNIYRKIIEDKNYPFKMPEIRFLLQEDLNIRPNDIGKFIVGFFFNWLEQCYFADHDSDYHYPFNPYGIDGQEYVHQAFNIIDSQELAFDFYTERSKIFENIINITGYVIYQICLVDNSIILQPIKYNEEMKQPFYLCDKCSKPIITDLNDYRDYLQLKDADDEMVIFTCFDGCK